MKLQLRRSEAFMVTSETVPRKVTVLLGMPESMTSVHHFAKWCLLPQRDKLGEKNPVQPR